MKKFILIIFMAVAAGFWGCSFFGPKLFADFEVGKTFTVNFSFPDLAEEEFGDREKADQAKDWLLYILMTNSGLQIKDIAYSSFDLAPVRYGFNQAIANFEYGPTRCRYIGDGEVVALVPESNKKERIDNLAHIFDETRKNQGKWPKKAYVFEYELNVEGRFARLVRLKDVRVEVFFTSEMGYYEMNVNSSEELKLFLTKIDDVTYAEKTSDGLIFGGRKLQNEQYGKIAIEDIAAIWQSENELQRNLAERDISEKTVFKVMEADNKLVQEECQNKLDSLQFEDGTRLKDLTVDERNILTEFVGDMMYDTTTFGQSDRSLKLSSNTSGYMTDKNMLNLIKSFKADIYAFGKYYDKEIVRALNELGEFRVAYSSGFSLDPVINFDTSIAFVKEHLHLFKAALAPLFTPDQLLKQLKNREGDLMNYALYKIESINISHRCRYQKARYDGSLQGTAVGMTLFYTDLLAKMWTCNMFNSKPVSFIPDFVDVEQTIIGEPKVFVRESDSLTNVRLWFGPNKNGYQVSGNGSAINFARNATQIFALGNNPNVEPDSTGKYMVLEQQASAQFETALSWWSNRYEEVARYEKEYERLNEIMKWSAIISWLNSESSSTDLKFLDSYPVNHDLWFPDWVKSNSALKFKIWDQVNFFQKGFANNNTEAMPILSSPRLLVIGGVSLADRSMIKESPEILAAEKQIFRRANLTEDLDEPNTFETFRNTKISFVEEPEGTKININLLAKEGYKLRNNFGEVENKSFKWTLLEEAKGTYSYHSAMGDVPIGKLNATKTGKNSFAVTFESQSIDKGMSIARQCSDFNGDLATFFKNLPEVVRYVETENGQWCVQLEKSDEWMVLNIHPNDYEGTVNLPSGWTARTSGTTFDSRIIEMKWVSESVVAKLIRKPVPVAETGTDIFTGSSGKFYENIVKKAGKNGVEKELTRLREEGITEAERLATNGEYVKSAMYIEKLIKYLGETDALVAMKTKYDLKAGLYMIENNNLFTGIRFVNQAINSHPLNINIRDELSEMLGVSTINSEPKRIITYLLDCYLTDKQIFAQANWQGYGACSKKVSFKAIASNGIPKIFLSDNGAFSKIDLSAPFETVMSQIRRIPGAEVYDISANTVGRNIHLYANVVPDMLLPGFPSNRVQLRVSPGAINHCNDKNRNNERKCEDSYTVKGPVFYITAPSNLN